MSENLGEVWTSIKNKSKDYALTFGILLSVMLIFNIYPIHSLTSPTPNINYANYNIADSEINFELEISNENSKYMIYNFQLQYQILSSEMLELSNDSISIFLIRSGIKIVQNISNSVIEAEILTSNVFFFIQYSYYIGLTRFYVEEAVLIELSGD